MRSVIFDLDGTLADTSGDLIAAANACFRRRGAGDLLDPVNDMETAFNGGRAMLRLGLSRLETPWGEAEVDVDYPYLLEYYGNNINHHTRLYDGAAAALDHLAAAGIPLGICTNKPAALAEILLKQLGIRDRFGAMLGADSIAVRKPDPEHLLETIRRLGADPAQSVLVGDTITDRDTALAAKVPCILVTFGPASRDVVAMAPEALLDHFDDLPRVLDTLRH